MHHSVWGHGSESVTGFRGHKPPIPPPDSEVSLGPGPRIQFKLVPALNMIHSPPPPAAAARPASYPQKNHLRLRRPS